MKGSHISIPLLESYFRDLRRACLNLTSGSHRTLVFIFSRGDVTASEVSEQFDVRPGTARRFLLDLSSKTYSGSNGPEFIKRIAPGKREKLISGV